jgi:hypothetical protein
VKVHLHWKFQDPALMRGLTTGISLCGKINIPREQLTAHIEDATCKECLERSKNHGRR